MNFDDALSLMGGFGRYQILILIVYNITFAGNGWQYILTIFIAGRMDHWCKVPELQHLNETIQKLIAIPQRTDQLGDTIFKQCSMFKYNYSAFNFTDPDTINSWIGNGTTSEIACNNGWVFDKSVRESTAVSEFGLVCGNDWMYTLPATFQMLGFLVGAFLSGLLSDRFGRKRTTIAFMICAMGAIIGGSFSENFILFLLMRFLSTLTAFGSFTALWVLTFEMMSPVHRTLATILSCLLRVLRGSLVLTALYVRGHKWLQIISALVTIPGFIGALFLTESPRWLIARGRYQEAETISRRIAKLNRANLPDDFTLADDASTKVQPVNETLGNKKVSVIDLFRTPNIRKRTLLIWAQWFALVFGAYAMSLNVGILVPGDIYLNTFIVNALGDSVSVIILWIVLFKMGRKTLIIAFFFINSILAFAMIGLLPIKINALTTTAALCGTILISILFRVLYLYSSEIFPTPARNVGLGSGSSFGRVGGLISPSIPLLGNIWYGLPYLTLGVFPLIAGTLAFLLPETKDKRLPETFIEAELFGTKKMDDNRESGREAGTISRISAVGLHATGNESGDIYNRIENMNRDVLSNGITHRKQNVINEGMIHKGILDLTML